MDDSYEDSRQQAAYINPYHTAVTPPPIKTPTEVQLGFAAVPMRYLPRALAKSATDSASPKILHQITGVNWLRDNLYLPGYVKELNNRLGEFEDHFRQIFPNGTSSLEEKDITHKLRQSEEGRKLIDDIGKIQGKWDASDLADNTIQYFMRERERGFRGISQLSRKRLQSKMSESMFEILFDNMLGLGSMTYTTKVTGNVHKDIMSIYREAVSYETGKDPSEITDSDIASSDNQIVQSTVKNFRNKRMYRYGISALPFIKNIKPLKAMQWGEATVAAWGILWAVDIMGREPTMLESFRAFVNNKLNPLYGIGDPIKSSEVIDIYQQYAYRFAQDQAFQSLSTNNEDANLMWAQSEKIFIRIADLMNESYNFKHTTQLDPETNTPITKANFTLPKLIYLMGHGLINTRRPEWSMAYIEIANEYGMDAVKDAAKMMHDNAEIRDVLEQYPVDLNPTRHINGLSRAIVLPDQEQALPETDAATQPETGKPVIHEKADNDNAKDTATMKPANNNHMEAADKPATAISAKDLQTQQMQSEAHETAVAH